MMKNWIVPEFQSSITKQPAEEVKISCDFSAKVLPYFGKLTSATFSAEKWHVDSPSEKTDGSDILQQASIEIADPYATQAKIIVSGGNANYDYFVKCLAETQDGQIFQKDFFVRVKEL